MTIFATVIHLGSVIFIHTNYSLDDIISLFSDIYVSLYVHSETYTFPICIHKIRLHLLKSIILLFFILASGTHLHFSIFQFMLFIIFLLLQVQFMKSDVMAIMHTHECWPFLSAMVKACKSGFSYITFYYHKASKYWITRRIYIYAIVPAQDKDSTSQF